MEIFTYTETIVIWKGWAWGGEYTEWPRFEKKNKKTKTVSSHFLIVEGLALCSLYTKFL